MTLHQEIEKASRQVSTDAFSLTIGELSNLYRDGDIIINPDFQRLFRWDIDRKSRLIESLLVRIPLPSIFLFELPSSKWEVIDGLQRLSTILEFMGELKSPDTGFPIQPRSLVGTQYLPSLRGAFWSDELMAGQVAIDNQRRSSNDESFVDTGATYYVLDSDTQRAIKRTKISVQLLEKKSDAKSKYDLFQRLNSGGLTANDQELRNCAIVMVNSSFYSRLENFATSDKFAKLIPQGPSSIRKSNHLDNLCKIIAFSFVDYSIGTDIEEFVTNAMVSVASMEAAETDKIFRSLEQAIDLLIAAEGFDALRPFRNGKFRGKIGRTSIEVILVGILRQLTHVMSKPHPASFVRGQIIKFWQSGDFTKFSAAGISGTDRVQYTIPLGVALFSE
jgi:hypothetical protein